MLIRLRTRLDVSPFFITIIPSKGEHGKPYLENIPILKASKLLPAIFIAYFSIYSTYRYIHIQIYKKMGAATIIEKSLSENSQAFWNKVGPKVPELNIDTSKYSKGFVNFAMIVGLYATVKVGVAGFKKLNKSLKVNKALIGQKFR